MKWGERGHGLTEGGGRWKLTLAAVPAEAPRDVRGLDGALLAGLQQHKEPLQLVGDAGDRVLFRLR